MIPLKILLLFSMASLSCSTDQVVEADADSMERQLVGNTVAEGRQLVGNMDAEGRQLVGNMDAETIINILVIATIFAFSAFTLFWIGSIGASLFTDGNLFGKGYDYDDSLYGGYENRAFETSETDYVRRSVMLMEILMKAYNTYG